MSLDELVEKANQLKEKGLKTGSIADELNVSKKTAKWLISRGTKEERAKAPKDIFIEWDEIGKSSKRLKLVSSALCDMISEPVEDIDVVVGIAISGIPLSFPVAEKIDAELAVILPRKQRWDPGDESKIEKKGIISPNFANPEGKRCIIVDDIITTGTTMEETISSLNSIDAEPLSALVLLDKHGINNIDGVPVKSLLRVGRVE